MEYNYNNPGPQSPYQPDFIVEPEKPKKEKKPKNRFGAGTVILCMVLSLVCGFGGAYGYSLLSGSGGSGGGASADNPAVLYQSVNNGVEGTGNIVADVASLVADSVVEITTESASTSSFLTEYVTQGAGSGVILTEDGYIVTCAHVVDGTRSIKVTLSDGREFDATLIGSDSISDIAVLKIDATGLSPAVIGDSGALVVGEDAIVVGNPLGSLGGSVTSGIISALEREVSISGQSMTLLQTNAAVNPGNSGGGLFNAKGELIGIVNAKSAGTDIEGIGFAIPVNDMKDIVTNILENGYVSGRPALGVEVIDINSANLAMQYNVKRYGVLIANVSAGGGAQSAGIQNGDFLLSIGETAVNEVADITTILSAYEVGNTVSVQIIRNDRIQTYEVVLGELNG